MSAQVYSRPLIPLLIGLMAGIILGSRFAGLGLWAAGTALSGMALIFVFILQNRTARIIPLLLLIAAGYLSVQPWIHPRFTSNHIRHYLDSQPWKVVGVIDDHPQGHRYGQRFVLRAETLEHNNESFPVTGKLRVTLSGLEALLNKGDRISFTGRMRSIRNFNNPGGFNYKRYLAFQGVWATTYTHVDELAVLSRGKQNNLSAAVSELRRHIAGLIENCGDDEQIGVLKALVIGDRSSISADTREAFNRAGVGHLLAISGLHIGIVASVSFVFFQWVLRNFEFLLWKAWIRKGAALLSLLPVVFYGMVSGFSPSTQRAVIMVSVFLLTFLFEREHDLINTLALAAMIILVAYPPSLFLISFQLSFAAVLFIILGLACLQNRLNPIDAADGAMSLFQIKRKLKTFFFVSVFAIGGTLPLAMFYFNQISMIGILANFILVPCAGFVVVPLGLLAVFVSPVCLVCTIWCFKACGAVLSICIKIIHFLANLPFSAFKTVTPSVFEISCYYLLTLALLSLSEIGRETAKDPKAGRPAENHQPGTDNELADGIRNQDEFFGAFRQSGFLKLRFWKWGPRPWGRRKLAGVVAVLAILALTGDICYWTYQRFWHNDLRVTVIDVGQGSSALVEFPGGRNMLIDGGGFSDNSVFDMGARVVAPFLWQKKIKTIHTMVLSHPNSDHLNGLIYIAKNFNVETVWSNNEMSDTNAHQMFSQIIADNGINAPKFQQLPRQQNINGVKLNIIYPPKNFLAKKTEQKWRNLNNNSLVIRIAFGSVSFLFSGDIMADAEKELVSTCGQGVESTVLLAPHHGSKSSSTASFLDRVSPEVVIISSGRKTGRYYPHPAVLRRYTERNCRIYRTDTHGAISMESNGKRLLIKPFIVETAGGRI